MAGLYNVWQNDGTIIYSYSIITMNSNNTLDWLHHRMPAILDSQEQIEVRKFYDYTIKQLNVINLVMYFVKYLFFYRHGLIQKMLMKIWLLPI